MTIRPTFPRTKAFELDNAGYRRIQRHVSSCWSGRLQGVGLHAEDVAADAIVRLLERGVVDGVRSWGHIRYVTDNLVKNAIRDAQARRRLAAEAAALVPDRTEVNPTEGSMGFALDGLLDLLVRETPWSKDSQEIEAIRLILLGETTADAADAVGAPYHAVVWWRRRARKVLEPLREETA